MTAFEIVLLLCGAACVIVSYVLGNGKDTAVISADVSADITEQQKEKIKKQVSDTVEEELELLIEKTEVSLDRISNTKIMEMNDYSEAILKQIEKNHNEVVFLYDMLNEKAKELKLTVKDINVTMKQAESRTEKSDSLNEVQEKKNNSAEKTDEDDNLLSASAVAMLTGKGNADNKPLKNVKKAEADSKKESDKPSDKETEKKPSRSKKTKKAEKEVEIAPDIADMNIQFEKGANNNEKILKLYRDGKNNKDIAKELNLGIGEVKLVIDLYNSGK